MEQFAKEAKGLAERVLEIMCKNLGLVKAYLKQTLARDKDPFFGIKCLTSRHAQGQTL